MPGLPIREDLSAEELRRQARREIDGRVGRRLLAIANALDGMSRKQAARAAGMDRQTLRDWVIRYNRGGAAALFDAWGDGRPCWLSEGQQATLRAIVLAGPDPAVAGVSTWRVIDLCAIVRERFGIGYSESGLAKLLHALDLSWQTPRPQHPQSDPAAQVAFKKNSGRCSIGSPPSSRQQNNWKSGSSMKRASVRRAG
jgi:putative transposase